MNERLGDVNINATNSSMPAKILLYSTAAIFLTLGMKEIASVLVPVFYSLFFFLLFAPLVRWLQRKGVPGTVSVLLVILFFIFIFIGSAIVVAGSLLQLSSLIPSYEIQLIGILDNISDYLPAAGVSVESALRSIATFTFNLTRQILTGVLNAGTTIALILITTTFLLLDAAGAPKKVQRENKDHPVLLLRCKEYGRSLLDYIIIRTAINLLAGIGTVIFLFVIGIDFAVLWGLLFFVLGYIPYLGFYLAAIPPMLLGLFKYGPIGALFVLAGIAIINTFVENILFPSLAGKALKLSPSIVFLSLFFWAYVLGGSGALIAVPLTMVVKMILESFDETWWLAKLMESSDSKDQEEKKASENS